MINTPLARLVRELDMQLVGKLAFSAATFFFLALAFRFYKSKNKQKPAIGDGRGDQSRESGSVGVPRVENVQLRHRQVNRNLANHRTLTPESLRQAGDPVTTPGFQDKPRGRNPGTEIKVTGDKSSDAIDGDQENIYREKVNKTKLVPCDPQSPLLSPDPSGGDLSAHDSLILSSGPCEEDLGAPDEHSMVGTVCGIPDRKEIQNGELNQDHKTMHKVHRFSSVAQVKVEENFIPERQSEKIKVSPKHPSLRGKIYDYHVESTSETVTPDKHFKFGACTPTTPPCHPPDDLVETEVGLRDGDVQGWDLECNQRLTNWDLLTDRDTTVGNEQRTLFANGVTLSPNCNVPPGSKGATANTQSTNGNSTFHVCLTPESTFDVHLGLENCLEVLCLAKKHDLGALKTAAYKVMSDNYLQVLQNPHVYGRLNASERELILKNRMMGRRYMAVADIDTMGYSVSDNSTLSYYDSDTDSWHHLSNIPAKAVSRACSMAAMFNYLFIALGCQGFEREMKPTKRVVCYNPLTDVWQDICPLNDARPLCKLVTLNGYLYAIGGECLHTVERYDPRQNRWTYVAPLPNDTFAVAHMATAYDGEIYVTGGTIRYMLLRYRQKENSWKSSAITGSKDRTTELVATNNFLYRFDLNRSKGISVHRCNVRARIWYECASYPMPYPTPFQCVAIDNSIYCISRNFHLRLLADDVSPRFMEHNLRDLPCPKGILSPLVIILPGKDSK